MLHIRRVLSTPVTFRFPVIRAPTLRPRKKPCRRGDHLPSRANSTRNLKTLSLLFGISIMSQAAMTLEPGLVDLHQTRAGAEPDEDGLGTHDHYRFDHSSASALSEYSQTSDTPDTPDASSGPPSQSTELTHPQDTPLEVQPLQTSSLPSSPPLHSPRSTRSQSLAASLGCQSPIRRKPLSPTASPLAVRFSARSHHMTPHEMQEPGPEPAFYSLDSPDLYDLSPGGGPAPAAALAAPLEVHSEEE